MEGPAQAWATRALVAAAALAAPVALVSPLAIAPLFVVATLACLPCFVAARAWRELAAPLPALLAAGIAWAGASAAWALDPARVATSLPPIALSACGGLVLVAVARRLAEPSRAKVGAALAVGLCLALSVLSVEAMARYLDMLPTPHARIVALLGRGFDPAILNRATTVVAISCWIAAALAWRHGRRALAVMLPLWTIAILPAFSSQAAILAWLAGAASAIGAASAPRLARAAMVAGIAGGFSLMPAIPNWAPFHDHFADRGQTGSVWHRAEIWSFVAGRIADKPVRGWGLDSSRDMPGGKGKIDGTAERLPLHPHNGILQLWLELGAIGAAIGAAIAMLGAWRATMPGADAPSRFAMAGSLAAALAVYATAYGAWQGWWMATLWLVAAFAQVAARAEPPR
jgi:O-antigen ligase